MSHRPYGIDVDRPSAARIYDYALGGAHNFAADRAAGDALAKALPDGLLVARSNRAFLQRAVRFCCGEGITQFLDLGSGIPTVGNVHEIAQHMDPACHVVYVDNDPVAVATTRQLLASAGSDHTAIVEADFRDADAVLDAPETRRLIDFDRPLALMMVAALHYVSHEDGVLDIVGRYRAKLVPGSYVAISHTTEDPRPEVAAVIKKIFDETATPVTHRTREEVAALFEGLEVVEPGVVWTPEWRPVDATDPLHHEPARSSTFAAVGRVPLPGTR